MVFNNLKKGASVQMKIWVTLVVVSVFNTFLLTASEIPSTEEARIKFFETCVLENIKPYYSEIGKKALVSDVFRESSLNMLQGKASALPIVKENLDVLLWSSMAFPAIKDQDTKLFVLVSSIIYYYRSGDFKPLYTVAIHAEQADVGNILGVILRDASLPIDFEYLLSERAFLKINCRLFDHWKKEKIRQHTDCVFELGTIKHHFLVKGVLNKMEPHFCDLFSETPFIAEISKDCESISVGSIPSYYKYVIRGTGLEEAFFKKMKQSAPIESFSLFAESLDKDEKQLFLKIAPLSETKASK
jgi:hypothetical protein